MHATFTDVVVDLAAHSTKLRSLQQAKADTLLTRYRAFRVVVGCAMATIERVQAEGDLNASDLVTRLAMSRIRAAQEEIGDVG